MLVFSVGCLQHGDRWQSRVCECARYCKPECGFSSFSYTITHSYTIAISFSHTVSDSFSFTITHSFTNPFSYAFPFAVSDSFSYALTYSVADAYSGPDSDTNSRNGR